MSQSEAWGEGELDSEIVEAIQCDDVAGLRRLLAAGRSLSGRHRRKWGPMAMAARHGCARMGAELLRQGALINEPGPAGNLPIHFCADDEEPQMMSFLLANGADPNAKNDSLGAPLARASESNSLKVAALLLAAGADPNAFDLMGDSALSRALYQPNDAMAQLLLGAGADPTLSAPEAPSAAESARALLSPAHLYGERLSKEELAAARAVVAWEREQLERAAQAGEAPSRSLRV